MAIEDQEGAEEAVEEIIRDLEDVEIDIQNGDYQTAFEQADDIVSRLTELRNWLEVAKSGKH